MVGSIQEFGAGVGTVWDFEVAVGTIWVSEMGQVPFGISELGFGSAPMSKGFFFYVGWEMVQNLRVSGAFLGFSALCLPPEKQLQRKKNKK